MAPYLPKMSYLQREQRWALGGQAVRARTAAEIRAWTPERAGCTRVREPNARAGLSCRPVPTGVWARTHARSSTLPPQGAPPPDTCAHSHVIRANLEGQVADEQNPAGMCAVSGVLAGVPFRACMHACTPMRTGAQACVCLNASAHELKRMKHASERAQPGSSTLRACSCAHMHAQAHTHARAPLHPNQTALPPHPRTC